MRRTDPRWLIVALANLLLCWLVGLLNHALAGLAVSLYVGGLLVTYAALRLDTRSGLTATLVTGLLVDAFAPVPYGTSLFLFSVVHGVLLYGRHRFPREGIVFALVVALLANLFLMIALSFLLVGASPRPATAWLRIFADLFFSQLALAVIGPWFVTLQDRAMELAGIHPETGRPVVR